MKSKSLLLRIVLLIFISIWIIGFIPQLFNNDLFSLIYPFQKQIYSNVCHQIPDKSFTINQIHLLVCARCTGIYFGSLTAALIMIFFRGKLFIKTFQLILISLPLLLDVTFVSAGVYNYTKIFALITGLLFGSGVFIYILYSIENLLFKNE